MSRTLTRLNLVGVVALAGLCVFQWRTNRSLNLDINALQKSSQLQAVKITEQEKNLQGLSADLENFRGQLTRANAELRETSAKLQISERDNAQLTAERDQLKESIANWAAAVHVRDERIAEANHRIHEIGERLRDGAEKFNKLATRYNDTVKQLDELTVKYNAVITQLNEARNPAESATKPKSS
jgi:chromosome segregation ATPase